MTHIQGGKFGEYSATENGVLDVREQVKWDI
jgi:hypothetical protein